MKTNGAFIYTAELGNDAAISWLPSMHWVYTIWWVDSAVIKRDGQTQPSIAAYSMIGVI